jgi:hypothetical protein
VRGRAVPGPKLHGQDCLTESMDCGQSVLSGSETLQEELGEQQNSFSLDPQNSAGLCIGWKPKGKRTIDSSGNGSAFWHTEHGGAGHGGTMAPGVES